MVRCLIPVSKEAEEEKEGDSYQKIRQLCLCAAPSQSLPGVKGKSEQMICHPVVPESRHKLFINPDTLQHQRCRQQKEISNEFSNCRQ